MTVHTMGRHPDLALERLQGHNPKRLWEEALGAPGARERQGMFVFVARVQPGDVPSRQRPSGFHPGYKCCQAVALLSQRRQHETVRQYS